MKLLADYLFLTNEKASAAEYYKEALARVEARTEHDRAKPQTQSFSAQVLKGIARCLVAEGQLEEAEERFQKAMGMENARNPGASRAMLEYCQVSKTTSTGWGWAVDRGPWTVGRGPAGPDGFCSLLRCALEPGRG